jgi:NTE family protein
MPAIGLALGGGFARAIAHIGVLRVFERHSIPLHAVAGVSAGAIVAAARASGNDSEEIIRVVSAMRFSDVASWCISKLALASHKRMTYFLARLLKRHRFEEMRIPLCVVATDFATGKPVIFRGRGDVILPIRGSCSYPGLLQPIRNQSGFLVDGAISMEIPAMPLRGMGATYVISVYLSEQDQGVAPRNMLQVVNRCFRILQARTEKSWREHSDLIIAPDVTGIEWNSFRSAPKLIEAGERAAEAAIPEIRAWLGTRLEAPAAGVLN